MHAQLSLERTLKLDAFDRVDNLQAQVLDTEREGGFVASSRPTSATISEFYFIHQQKWGNLSHSFS